jgi:hypothetical protein
MTFIAINYVDIRRIRLLRVKAPGPYEDTVGPTVLTIVLMGAIVTQFGCKLYHITMR